MRPIIVKNGPLAAANATAVAASQSVSAGSSVILNGSTATNGVATLDMPRQVAIASAGNDSGITFTLVGTNWSGQPWTEVLTGADVGSVNSALDYATLTRITPSGTTTSTITVGTTSFSGGPWVRFDDYAGGDMTIQEVVSGTVTATLQSSLDDPNSPSNPVQPSAMNWVASPDPSMSGFTASGQSNFNQHQVFVRTAITAGSGSVTTTYLQGGAPAV